MYCSPLAITHYRPKICILSQTSTSSKETMHTARNGGYAHSLGSTPLTPPQHPPTCGTTHPNIRHERSPRPPSRLGGDRCLGHLHSHACGTRIGFAVPSLCPWRRLCLRLLCKLHKIWSVDSQDNH